jgi:ribosomal protein L37AE/L43A
MAEILDSKYEKDIIAIIKRIETDIGECCRICVCVKDEYYVYGDLDSRKIVVSGCSIKKLNRVWNTIEDLYKYIEKKRWKYLSRNWPSTRRFVICPKCDKIHSKKDMFEFIGCKKCGTNDAGKHYAKWYNIFVDNFVNIIVNGKPDGKIDARLVNGTNYSIKTLGRAAARLEYLP